MQLCTRNVWTAPVVWRGVLYRVCCVATLDSACVGLSDLLVWSWTAESGVGLGVTFPLLAGQRVNEQCCLTWTCVALDDAPPAPQRSRTNQFRFPFARAYSFFAVLLLLRPLLVRWSEWRFTLVHFSCTPRRLCWLTPPAGFRLCDFFLLVLFAFKENESTTRQEYPLRPESGGLC